MGFYRSTLDVIVLMCILSVNCSNMYDRKCPESSQWNFLQSKKCENEKPLIYQCLFEVETSSFKEYCGTNEIAREGFKYELKPNPDQVDCSSARYQPFSFSSVQQSQCIYEKSGCSEVGQIIFNDGSTKSDRTCRCDYTKNYMFVNQPKNRCFCIPSEEDCSCYYNPCSKKKPIMIADYRCVNVHVAPIDERINCTKISNIRHNKNSQDKHVEPLEDKQKIERESEVSQILVVIPVVCGCILVTVLILLLFYAKPSFKYTLTGVFTCDKTNNVYTVVEGETVIINAEVHSYLPVKSVKWEKNYADISTNEWKGIRDKTSKTSLEIENIGKKDEGNYKCVATDCFQFWCFRWLTEANSSAKQDFITIQVITSFERSIETHRDNKLYVRTSAVDQVIEYFDKVDFVLVTGREGSGKSTLCVEIASWCLLKRFRPVIFEMCPVEENAHNDCNTVYIIDNIKPETFDIYNLELKTRIKSKSQTMVTKILATCEKRQEGDLKEIMRCKHFKFQLLDIDSSLRLEEKRQILKNYTTEYNVELSNCETLKRLDIHPWLGFSLTTDLFCKDMNKFHYSDGFFYKLVKEFCQNAETRCQMSEYMYKWVLTRNEKLRTKLIESIDCFRFKEVVCEKITTERTQAPITRDIHLGNVKQYCESNSDDNPVLSVSAAISLIEKLTDEGRDMWIYDSNTSYFVLLCGMIAALKGDYHKQNNDAFKMLWDEVNKNVENTTFVEYLNAAFDIDGDSFLPYLTRYKEIDPEAFNMIAVLLAHHTRTS